MIREKSFSARLSIDIVFLMSILFIVAIAAVSISSHTLIADEAENSARNLLDGTINQVEKALVGVEHSVKEAAWFAMENKDDEEFMYHLTRKMVEENDFIVGSAVAFEKSYFPDKYYYSPYSYLDKESGEILSKQLGNPEYDYFYIDWFQIPSLTGEPCWSEPYYDEGGGEYLMSTYSYPLKDADGHVYAILTADLSLQWISDALADIKPYPDSYVTILSRGGYYINIDEERRVVGETVISAAMALGNPDVLDIAESMVRGEKGFKRYAIDGNMSFAVYGPLENGWSAGIICSYREILKRASKMHGLALLISLFSLIILFIACYLMVRHLTKPLSSFSESAKRIAEGDFNTPLPEIDSQDEIKDLRDSFEYMERSLTSYIDDLKATTAANERYSSELNIASGIQNALLPKDFPDMENMSLHAFVKPAKEVGGDLYDFVVKDDKMYFLVGDVSGKGVPAAMVMSITKEAFKLVGSIENDIAKLAYTVNNALCDNNQSGMFVTLFVGKLNLKTGLLEYCNCGHNPVVISPENGDPYFLDVKSNIALGVFDHFPYEGQNVTLEKGTRIVLYTDGVTEAERADKQQYGEERLLDWARETASRDNSSEEDCESLMQSVKDFTGGNEQNDDITIMTIKIKN